MTRYHRKKRSRRPRRSEQAPAEPAAALEGGEGVVAPHIGCWYRDVRQRRFEVADLEEQTGRIIVQFFNGERGTLDRGAWEDMVLEIIARPEEDPSVFRAPGEYDAAEPETPLGAPEPEPPQQWESGSEWDEPGRGP